MSDNCSKCEIALKLYSHAIVSNSRLEGSKDSETQIIERHRQTTDHFSREQVENWFHLKHSQRFFKA